RAPRVRLDVRSAGAVAGRRRSLSLADGADLLSLHIRADGAGRLLAARLDQHGRRRDLDAGRRHAGAAGQPVTAGGRHRALREGPDAILLGHRHLVDSHARGAWPVALPAERPADRLRRARLGRRLSARDVLGVDLRPDGGRGRAVPARRVLGVHHHRARGVGVDPARLGHERRGAMIARFTDFGLAGPSPGQMKAVLHQMAPGIPVIDLLADAPVGNPKAGAYLLAAYAAWFPEGTVFLGVIDPGVGGPRPAV